jgi:hypothetical protein
VAHLSVVLVVVLTLLELAQVQIRAAVAAAQDTQVYQAKTAALAVQASSMFVSRSNHERQ